MSHEDKKEDNVVSLFGNKKETSESSPTKDGNTKLEDVFRDAVERNRKTKERLRSERLKANKSVLKSYRIKSRDQ